MNRWGHGRTPRYPARVSCWVSCRAGIRWRMCLGFLIVIIAGSSCCCSLRNTNLYNDAITTYNQPIVV